RTVTRAPSPLFRSIDTPVIRCSDSARLVSGNLPMSSAEIASTTPCAFRLTSIDRCKLPLIPVTTISSTMSPLCAKAVPLSPTRSEEHTSELQSRENLVCRLLLEKKKYSRKKQKIFESVQP